MARRFTAAMAASLLVAGCLAPGLRAQAAPAGVSAGILTCNVGSGWGLVLGSSRSLACVYSPRPGVVEHYNGSFSKFGVDIGYLQNGVIVWAVFAPTLAPAPGALDGVYGGATGSATLGLGLGANVLFGGSNHAISLQPVSVEGSQGVDVAGGIAAISLHYQS